MQSLNVGTIGPSNEHMKTLANKNTNGDLVAHHLTEHKGFH